MKQYAVSIQAIKDEPERGGLIAYHTATWALADDDTSEDEVKNAVREKALLEKFPEPEYTHMSIVLVSIT